MSELTPAIEAALSQVNTIVTHADCPDGIASAMILARAFEPGVIKDVIFAQYNTPSYNALEAKPGVIFCDITPARERVAEFIAAGAIVLDHHKHARDIVEAFGELGAFAHEDSDPGVSGALLAYQVWQSMRGSARTRDEIDATFHLAYLAGIRDTWQRDSEAWDEACAQAEALTFYGPNRFLDSDRAWLTSGERDLGMLLLKKRRAEARDIVANGLHAISDDGIGSWMIYNAQGRTTSDVGDALRDSGCAADGLVGFHFAPSGDQMQIVFSMRSIADGCDVGAIALANGGGGHTRAAGFSLPVTRLSPGPVRMFVDAVAKAGDDQ